VVGFPPLAQSAGEFELWISFPGARQDAKVSLGRFHLDDRAQVVGPDYQPITFALDAASAAVPKRDDGSVAWELAVDALITLEPEGDDPGAGPTLPALISGPFVEGLAQLDVAGGDAIRRDFSGISGAFHLATPTTSTADDEREGIWFATVGGDSASLVLPDLPAGWVYIAWHSLLEAESRSLGSFPTVTGVDSNGWGPPTGDRDGYAFPGHDFPWGPGVDLLPGSVFVTIEPADGRDGDGPFHLLELLGNTMPQTAATMQPMVDVAAFPTATGTVPFTR
jgi:hypothetical protein